MDVFINRALLFGNSEVISVDLPEEAADHGAVTLVSEGVLKKPRLACYFEYLHSPSVHQYGHPLFGNLGRQIMGVRERDRVRTRDRVRERCWARVRERGRDRERDGVRVQGRERDRS